MPIQYTHTRARVQRHRVKSPPGTEILLSHPYRNARAAGSYDGLYLSGWGGQRFIHVLYMQRRSKLPPEQFARSIIFQAMLLDRQAERGLVLRHPSPHCTETPVNANLAP